MTKDLSKSLATNWHLLPAIATGDQPLTVGQVFAGIVYGQLLRYDTLSSSLTSVQATDPALVGQSYYVQVLSASTWAPPLPAEVTTITVYDGDGGRTKLTTSAGTTRFLGESVEIAPGGTVTKYVFAGSQRIAAKDSDGTLRFYHGDHLGSSNVITDGTGALVELNEHTPYGALSRHEGSTDVAHKFTGQRLDPATGLYFYHARYYDSTLGRFIQPDSIVQAPADPQTLNRYSYARNNPVRYVDPSGHFFFIPFLIAALKIAVIGAAVGAVVGAVFGGIGAAVTGQSIGRGIAMGALGGAVFGATAFTGGALLGVLAPAFAGSTLGQLAVLTAAGAVSGGVTSSVQGGSFGTGALTGAVVSAATFGVLKGVGASPLGQAIGRSSSGQAVGKAWGTLTRPLNNALNSATAQLQTAIKGQPFQGRIVVGPLEAPDGTPLETGTKVYRVWGTNEFGEGSGPYGPSWTIVDPRTVPDYRGAAGLRSGNTGRFLSEGTLRDTTGITTRPALYGPDTKPGTSMVPEVQIPNAQRQVDIQNVSGLNPEF